MKLKEAWTDSQGVHTKIKSAYDSLDNLDKDDKSYDVAKNLLLAADAYLSAIDSINSNEDELKRADDLSDFYRDTSKLSSTISSSYSKILKYIDGSKPSGTIEESGKLSESGFDFDGGTKYNIDNWVSDRLSYASDLDRSTLAKYKNSLQYISKEVIRSFPTKVGARNENKVKSSDIVAESADTNPAGFDNLAKYYNKTLTNRRMVGKVPGLPETILYSGVDKDTVSSSNKATDITYLLLVTKGKIVTVFYLDPDLLFGGEEEEIEWNV